MKKLLVLIFAIATLVIASQGCSKSPAPAMEKTTLSILVDATDSVIFNDIQSDFNQNLVDFLQRTGIGKMERGKFLIKKGEFLTVKMAPMTAAGDLRLKQASIGMSLDMDLSGKELEKRTDLRQILSPMMDEMDRFEQLARTEQKYSPLVDVILKCIREMDATNGREILMVFTDGYENSEYLNMYRKIPTTEDQVLALMEQIDPVLLKEATTRISEVDPELLFVLKCKSANKEQVAKKGQIKLFYSELCKQLGVSKVSFVDNMSNSI